MNRVLALLGMACITAAAHAQPTGRLFVGQYAGGFGDAPPVWEADLNAGFPSVSWGSPFAFEVSGAAATPGSFMYFTQGAFTTDLYESIPGRTPSLKVRTSVAIGDMGYVNGKLYGWANFATPKGIYEINTQTGECTLAVASESELFFALDGNPADGLLYGFSEYGTTGLWSINPVTGEKRHIAPPPPTSQFPNSYGACRGLAVGNNTVYLTNTWSSTFPDDPDASPTDNAYAYALSQGNNGAYVAFTNPYAGTGFKTGGALWYDPAVTPDVPLPANDLCANATPVGEGSFTFDTNWSTTDGSSSFGGDNDVWFRYTPTHTYRARFTTCNGDDGDGLDVVISLHAACDGTELTAWDQGLCDQVFYDVTAGVPVLVRVATYSDDARGIGTLTIGECEGVTIDGQPNDATITRCTASAPSSSGNHFARFVVFDSGREGRTYQWHRNGLPLTSSFVSEEEYGILRADSWAMLIIRPTAADAGVYTCVITAPATADCPNAVTVTTEPATLTFCAADFNCAGGVDVADIFSFLSAWFGQAAGSDFNNSGATDVADIFSFLSAWFAGC